MSESGVAAEITPAARRRRFADMTPFAVVALVAAALTILITMVLHSVPIWMADFTVYHAAGKAVLEGSPLYDLRIDTAAISAMLYTYPPFAALLFAPLSLLGMGVSGTLWTFANALALGGVLWLSLGLVGVFSWKRRIAITAGAMVIASLLTPVLMNTVFGQVNVFLMLLVLVDFSPARSERWRGIAIGVVAGLKLIPLIFVVYLLCIGCRQAAARAVAAFLGTILLGFVFLPADSRLYWLGGLFFDASRIADTSDLVNQSLPGLFARLAGTSTAPGWWLPVCLAVGLLGLLAASWAKQRGHDMVGILVVAFTALLVSPTSWPHHAVWIVPALVWLAFAVWRAGSVLPRVVLVATTIWFMVPVYWLVVPSDWGAEQQLTAVEHLVVAVTGYLGVTMLALALIPVWLRRLQPAGTGGANTR